MNGKSKYQIAADIWNNTPPENRHIRFDIRKSDICPALIEANFYELDIFAANAIIDILKSKGYIKN